MARMQAAVLSLALALAVASTFGVGSAPPPPAEDPTGRWDLMVGTPDATYPSWLEITRTGGKLAGRFVGKVGSARPIKSIEFSNGALVFSLPPQYEKTKTDLVFNGTLSPAGDGLLGKTRGEDGAMLPWSAVRAPKLPAVSSPKWGSPIQLSGGKDMAGWRVKDQKLPNGWRVASGVLENTPPSGDIVTTQKFTDFKLHLEFNVAPKSNSGVYLRGRYEVQIEDNFGQPPESHLVGGVYGFLDPTENAGKPAGEWQTYDITLLGRTVTVVLNGKTVINAVEIPGITGGALDSREGEPGPLMLQGDHGKVAFRNIVLTPIAR